MKLRVAARSDVGRVRGANEDSYVVDKALHLFAVCDGMGGHAAGEVASSVAVKVLRDAIRQHKSEIPTLIDGTPEERARLKALVLEAVRLATLKIFRMSRRKKELRGMGTTLTLMLLGRERAMVAHVGDTRLYLLRDGQVHQITTDHSLVNEMIRAGRLDPAEAENVSFTNALTRAVGVQPNVDVDILEVDLLPGDGFLLCSDGLHNYLKERSLLTGFRQRFEERVDFFIDLANQSGGKDNITAIVLQIDEVEDAAKTARLRLTLDTLRDIPLFRHLSYAELTRVISVSRAREWAAGEVIIQQGGDGDALFVVLDGSVEVEQSGRKVAVLGAGRHFGEMSLVDNEPRSATVRATDTTLLIRIAREDFYQLLRQDSVTAVKLLWNFIQTLSLRLRRVSGSLTAAVPPSASEDVSLASGPLPASEIGGLADAYADTDPNLAAEIGEVGSLASPEDD
jgi:serine/threonine protein phosphatase PrpC/CRP-like cAMP-binding protein